MTFQKCMHMQDVMCHVTERIRLLKCRFWDPDNYAYIHI